MPQVVLFHHAHGLTPGVIAFANRLREAGHAVDTPDLFEGATFADLAEGVAHAEETGFDVLIDRGVAAVAGLPAEVVYAGFSLGALPAQKLAQTRPGALGALLYHSAVPTEMFGGPWPTGVPLQMHFMADDPWAEEDAETARSIAAAATDATVFEYPGSGHLFADPDSPDHDPEAAALLLERTLALLAAIDG